MIVGQANMLKNIAWMVEANCFPRFSIIVGEDIRQASLIASHVAKQLETFEYVTPDNKIDTIRDMIMDSYKIQRPMTYIITDADSMSVPAKNALLKITEEPPNNAYFIMILEDLNNTLDTIRSRAGVFIMEPYSKAELQEYALKSHDINDSLYTSICSTPMEIELLYKMGADSFFQYVSKVVDNIAIASGANCFKIADKVALKDEEDKYDLRMFWKACCRVFYHKAYDDKEMFVPYLEAGKVTSDYLQKLSIKGVNRQMLFDGWILAVRKVLM